MKIPALETMSKVADEVNKNSCSDRKEKYENNKI